MRRLDLRTDTWDEIRLPQAVNHLVVEPGRGLLAITGGGGIFSLRH